MKKYGFNESADVGENGCVIFEIGSEADPKTG